MKKRNYELRHNMSAILKRVDKFSNCYQTATMVAVIYGFMLGYRKGKQDKGEANPIQPHHRTAEGG